MTTILPMATNKSTPGPSDASHLNSELQLVSSLAKLQELEKKVFPKTDPGLDGIDKISDS